MRVPRAGAAVLGCVAVFAATGCNSDSSSGQGVVPTTNAPANTTASPHYSLAPTRRCLEGAGVRVGPVSKADPRLQALADLAQHTSLEVRRRAEVVGLALGDAALLSELLTVPNDPYTIETQGNALLMFEPSSDDLAVRVRGCLRE